MMRELTAAFLIVAAPAAAQVQSPQQAIEAEMAKSAAGWNAGDLDRFVAVYTSDAVYAAGNELARGRAEIAARYAKSFANGANTRGKLGVLSSRMGSIGWGSMATPSPSARQTMLTCRHSALIAGKSSRV